MRINETIFRESTLRTQGEKRILFIQDTGVFSIINKCYIEVGLEVRSHTTITVFEYRISAKWVAVCFQASQVWWDFSVY